MCIRLVGVLLWVLVWKCLPGPQRCDHVSGSQVLHVFISFPNAQMGSCESGPFPEMKGHGVGGEVWN